MPESLTNLGQIDPDKWEGHRQSYPMQKMKPKHVKILDYALQGMDATDIAGVMGLSKTTVSRQINTPIFQKEYARRRGDFEKQQIHDQGEFMNDAKQILEKAGTAAATTMVNLLQDQDASIKLRTAKEILEYSVSKESGGGVGGATINIEQLQILNTTLKESKVG